MATSDLIVAAKSADGTKATLDAALAAAQDADVKGAADDTAAHQAVFDDLTANGQALYVDSSTTPPTYYVAAPVAPGDFNLTPIRLA